MDLGLGLTLLLALSPSIMGGGWWNMGDTICKNPVIIQLPDVLCKAQRFHWGKLPSSKARRSQPLRSVSPPLFSFLCWAQQMPSCSARNFGTPGSDRSGQRGKRAADSTAGSTRAPTWETVLQSMFPCAQCRGRQDPKSDSKESGSLD